MPPAAPTPKTAPAPLRLEITGISETGAGTALLSGCRVFVEGTVPGDIAEVQLARRPAGAHSFSARLIRLASPSPDRSSAPCAAAGRCGGCPLAFLRPDAQLALKRGKLLELFAAEGMPGAPVGAVAAMPPEATEGFRNKAVFYFSTWRGQTQLGMYRARSHAVEPRSLACPQIPAWMREAAAALLSWAQAAGLPPRDEATGEGMLRSVLMREGSTGARLLTLAAAAPVPPEALEALTHELRRIGISEASVSLNRGAGNRILGEHSLPFLGHGFIRTSILGLTFRVRPETFLQVNTPQTPVLYATALEAAGIRPEDTVLDLYCGVGTLTLAAARLARRAVGIEIVPESIQEAENNARENGIRNASFACGAVESVLPGLAGRGIRPRIVIADPPRKGLEQTVPAVIASLAPETIVYIACGPAALARDARVFRSLGYQLESVKPVDLFPGTAHIEAVAKFCREQDPAAAAP